MAIVLIQYERRSLIRFLGFYIISSVSLLSLVAFLIFLVQKDQIYKHIKDSVLLKSSNIAQEAIYQHMSGNWVDLPKLFAKFEEKDSSFSLFDKNKNRLYGNLEFMESDKKFFIKNFDAYLLSNSTYGHLGVEWILIKTNFKNDIKKLIFHITIGTLLCLCILLIFGFIMGKMFLSPIHTGIKLLDHFIKDITHELNTPISALMMSVNSLQSGVNETKLMRIQKACKRINFLYDNLTFLFLGEIREVRENIDFLALLQNRIEMFETLLEEKQIKLVFQQKQKVFFFTDKESIIRMIDNLLSNAIKHNQSGGNIIFELSDKKLIVKNTGKAIPSDITNDITQRYVRFNLNSRGYGIGLDIIQKVVQKNKWTLKIYHQDGYNIFEINF
ncbi:MULTISPECIES: sensor histidine kinase [unclassified Helicobacter]|uniref:sensor histidine kinase n=1 Tax=unclassified Helicobacter TaxID=2593540 RepID=UPI000CF07E93|nr:MULTISPECIES: HAMP domain-containing sensor histidine kinase [unclassified Helicobacter]